jgi:hypothetical protein
MRNYNVISLDNGVEYLCRFKDWKMRPRVYWSKFPDNFNERIKFTLIGAYWQKFIIKILAPTIVTDIVKIKGR